ncbi:MAG: hypothetical protein ACTSUO_01785 [Candidatus Thorarchaeota archaeon]
MDSIEWYVRLCGEVGNYTKRITGTSIIDAYSGPEKFSPDLQPDNSEPSYLINSLESLKDHIPEDLESPLRQKYIIGEIDSLLQVVKWLSGEPLKYAEMVEGMFHIKMKRFSESEITRQISLLEEAIADFPGANLHEKMANFNADGKISGDELRILLETDLQQKAIAVGQEFKEKIFSLVGHSVTDNGVKYQAVSDKPWSGYNWYLGGFKSLNEFNIDRPFNKDSLLSVIYHEYEHHVSNLWREHAYLQTKNLELSIVPLHTGRCVVSEGTADTAKDFLGVTEDNPRMNVVGASYVVRRMTSINAAIMLNHEGKSIDEAVQYMIDMGLRTEESARGSIDFIRPVSDTGKVNIWAPYVFTYYIGRTDFVKPTFDKAIDNDMLKEFYKTLYLNPYSGSSMTWNEAFSWL